MVNSYGQKPMEKPWIITHGDFMEFFCKGAAEFLCKFYSSVGSDLGVEAIDLMK